MPRLKQGLIPIKLCDVANIIIPYINKNTMVKCWLYIKYISQNVRLIDTFTLLIENINVLSLINVIFICPAWNVFLLKIKSLAGFMPKFFSSIFWAYLIFNILTTSFFFGLNFY